MTKRWMGGPVPAGLVALALPVLAGISRAGGGEATGAHVAGGEFDAAPFGFDISEADGKAHGVRWGEPRKIRRVVVDFDAGGPVPSPAQAKARLQYWYATWDGRPDPVLAEAGAGGVGWAHMDDWTNGGWRDADATLVAEGPRWTFTFSPTGAKEFDKLGHPGVGYRKTLKLRLVSEAPLPKPLHFAALTDAVLQTLTVRIMWGRPADPAAVPGDRDDEGRIEVYNGQLTALRPLAGGQATVREPGQWGLAAGAEGGLEADLLMAVDPADARYDRTVVTVRSRHRPFSFAADEVARGNRILVDDLGVLVTRGDDRITLEGYRQARGEFPGRTVYERVFDEPEQTLQRAWNDMPLKRPLYFVHGLPGDRNTMHQDANGDVSITSRRRWFNLPVSPKDTQRKLWDGESLTLGFGFPGGHQDAHRELHEGYLPLLRTWWQDGPVHYEQTTILDTLDGNLSDIRLDDPTVLLMHIRLVNTSGAETAAAKLTLSSRPSGRAEKLAFVGDRLVVSVQGREQLRCLIRGTEKGTTVAEGDTVRWSLPLPPGGSHDLYVVIPSITLTQEDEIAALRARDFVADSRRVCEFWRSKTAHGAQIQTPEAWLNGFYKSHLRHMLVNCFQEIGSDRLHAHVGTFGYGVYPDESGMMISDLDRRGYHDEARRCLDSFLHYQGTVKMPGNFRTTEGLFYGSGGHDTGGYNKSHGWVMWNMADHWWMTRDRAWMEQAAPKLVKACEWVIRERQATMAQNADGRRPIEHGWLPAGSLEDVTDYWHWMVTNACTVWGFEALAAALADFGHADAPRLQKEADACRDDFLRAMYEARILTPVVRLRNGTYAPKYPSRLYERGRCHGWLRETLEGSIHLLITGLLPPHSPEARWILNDFEDNLYISDDYGYAIPVFDDFWFSRGGFSMQANLLGGPLPYLYRDEIKHYVRTYFNSLCSAFYPDIRMCNEHSMPELGYPAGDHFKSSDEAQSTYWLRLMFVHERAGDLYLGQAIPRYWLADGNSIGIEGAPSVFGPLTFQITSRAAAGQIKAVVTPPSRNRPKNICVRLRHPESKPIQSVTLNGRGYDRFDAAKEWIILPGSVEGPQELVARY